MKKKTINFDKKLKTKVKSLGILILALIIPMMLYPLLFSVYTGNTVNNEVENEQIDSEPIIDFPKTQDSGTVLTWWNETWTYRVRVEIKAQEETIEDVPMEKRINFTELLHELGDDNRFHDNSTRLIEYDRSTGKWIEIPCNVSKYLGAVGHPENDYNNLTNAVVDIFWLMNGTTDFNTNRTYFVYFDTQQNPNIPPMPTYDYRKVSSYVVNGRDTSMLIYGDYFRMGQFSAGEWRDGEDHDGSKENPFDNRYHWEIDEQDDYEGRVGKLTDYNGRQSHCGYDQNPPGVTTSMDFIYKSGYSEHYFPILKVAVKVDNAFERSALYLLTSGWDVIMYTPQAKDTQGTTYDPGVDKTHGCEINTDGEWRIYEYDLRRLGDHDVAQIEWFQGVGGPGSHNLWFDNLIAVKTDSPTLKDSTSYLIPESYMHAPERKRANIQVKAIDLYGNFIPHVNISIYNYSKQVNPLESIVAPYNGSVIFKNYSYGNYNFTVKMTSDLNDYTKVINITSTEILIEDVFQTINLTCNVSTNVLRVVDVDGDPIDSGWIIVGNATANLQNCTIDNTGKARFWWVNSTPYLYNYSVYYRDDNYNPQSSTNPALAPNLGSIILASGYITTVNTVATPITVPVNLTTVNFTIFSDNGIDPIDGAILILKVNNTNGVSIVNLTTNANGKTTLRWLNSSGIAGNYSLEISFFGSIKEFNITSAAPTWADNCNFTVVAEGTHDFKIRISLDDYQTQILSLNPSDNVQIKWGSQLKLRTLFNVSKTKNPATEPLGPIHADSMTYQLKYGGSVYQSGAMQIEEGNVGRHYALIDTNDLETGITYTIEISAEKSGYTPPGILYLSLYLLKNDLLLEQSEDDDSVQTTYWLENVNMSVKPYSTNTESFTIKENIFKDANNDFKFSIPDISTDWNLSRIVFNFYEISWDPKTDPLDVNITFIDSNGVYKMCHTDNKTAFGSKAEYLEHYWTGISLDIYNRSATGDNTFDFTIVGSFTTAILVAEAVFTRDILNVEYSKFNVTDSISIRSDYNGWAIKNITFELSNCYDSTTWTPINPKDDANLNITTNENFTYSLDSGVSGTGYLSINDITIYPLDGQFLFIIQNRSDIIFNVKIKVEYIQEFYKNQNFETLNVSKTVNGFENGNSFQITAVDSGWVDSNAAILISNLKNSTNNDVYPSDLGMTITIGGGTYDIEDLQTIGEGTFSLEGRSKDTILSAQITASFLGNFSLSFTISFSRTVVQETTGTVTYFLREAPDVNGTVQYYTDSDYYLQTINTSLINAREYTVRFTVSKSNCISAIKDLDLTVLNRLTSINGSTEFYKESSNIYVKDSVIYTFSYTDTVRGTKITDLKSKDYIWEQYDINGVVIKNGTGTLTENLNNIYELDLKTGNLTVGEYLIIVTLDKDNYELKNALISLNIYKRTISASLKATGKEGSLITVVKGQPIVFSLTLTDPTQGATPSTSSTINTQASIPLTGATVKMVIAELGRTFTFKEVADGVYNLTIDTNDPDYQAFFMPQTLTANITISKTNYVTQTIDITIVIGMDEWPIPGFPAFYFLMIVSAIIAVAGSLVTYRYIQLARIPKFVKNARAMKKAMKQRGEISESLLYPSKEEYMVKILGDKWEALGLSLEDILGIERKKGKIAPGTEEITEDIDGGVE